MKRLKGPELKLSELKVPAVVKDLYFDLRDRRLLPLIGLVLVAIVATPFLLGGGGKPPVEPVPPPAPSGSAQEASLTVRPSAPGLREPSKRLAGRPSKNPFQPHYTAPVLKQGAAPTSETSTGGSSSATVETAPEETGGGGGGSTPAPEPQPAPIEPSGGSGSSGSGSMQPGEIRMISFGIDIKLAHTEVTKSGDRKMGPWETREGVEQGSPLPGKKAPVLTYLGVDTELKKALMLVSTEATSLLGDNKCLAGTTTCQLLALEVGVPEVVEYGENGARYKFELLKIVPIKGPKLEEPLK